MATDTVAVLHVLDHDGDFVVVDLTARPCLGSAGRGVNRGAPPALPTASNRTG